MTITRIKLDQFTAFEKLDLKLSPGINVFLGANGTGKTHLMKVLYAACDITKSGLSFPEKLIRVFLPSGRAIGRLVKRKKTSSRCSIEIYRGDLRLKSAFTNHSTASESAQVYGFKEWNNRPVESVYIPVKEMLSNARASGLCTLKGKCILKKFTPIFSTELTGRPFGALWMNAENGCSVFSRRPSKER